MEKDLASICKGELSTENLFNKMREDSLVFFTNVQDRIKDLQIILENYLANGLKKDDFIKLNEETDKIQNNPNENNNQNSDDNINTEKINEIQSNESLNLIDKNSISEIKNFKEDTKKENYLTDGKINFALEYEINEKSMNDNEEIIKAIFAENNKDKKSSNDKGKIKFENSLRGILKMERKNINSETPDDETYSNSDNKGLIVKDYKKKDILELKYKCPSCKEENLRLLRNKSTLTYFIGCCGFPNCSFTKSINNPSKIVISDNFCEKCFENNKEKNLLFELEFNNLKKNSTENNKNECYICLMNDYILNKSNNNYNNEGNKEFNYKNKFNYYNRKKFNP